MEARVSGPRIAVIEIGTNSIKLVVAAVGSGGGFRVVYFSKHTTRIGRGLGAGSRLSSDAIERTLGAVERFYPYLGDDTRRFAFSTYALRKAAASPGTIRRLEKTLGCPLRILTGKEEARFAYRSARHSLRLSTRPAIMIDVGGGSTEIVFAKGERVMSARSTPLGALHLTERFLPSDPIAPDEFAVLEKYIRKRVTSVFRGMKLDVYHPARLDFVASGGTVTTITGMTGGDRFHVGTPVRAGDVSKCLERLLPLRIEERSRVPGLEPDRADIMPAGLAIVRAFLQASRKRVFRVNPGGVREGALLHLIDNGLQW